MQTYDFFGGFFYLYACKKKYGATHWVFAHFLFSKFYVTCQQQNQEKKR